MSALTHSFFAVASLNTNMKATLKYLSRLNYLANQIKDDDYDVCIQNFHHCNPTRLLMSASNIFVVENRN